MGEGEPKLNILIGTVVSLFLILVPFSAIVGGAITGFLQRGELKKGAKVGAVVGVILFVPVVFFTIFTGYFRSGWLRNLVVVPILLFIYFVAPGSLGGVIGAYLARETSFGE